MGGFVVNHIVATILSGLVKNNAIAAALCAFVKGNIITTAVLVHYLPSTAYLHIFVVNLTIAAPLGVNVVHSGFIAACM